MKPKSPGHNVGDVLNREMFGGRRHLDSDLLFERGLDVIAQRADVALERSLDFFRRIARRVFKPVPEPVHDFDYA